MSESREALLRVQKNCNAKAKEILGIIKATPQGTLIP